MTNEEFDDLMSFLEEQGAVYKAKDLNGEFIYKFNLDILREVLPELYDMIVEEFDQELLDLYQAGLVDVTYDEQLRATFSISEKGKAYIDAGFLFEDDVE
jgi:hypothetical protein